MIGRYLRTAGPLAVVIASVLLAGCADRGAVEHPVLRNLSWFSYVGGDDVRNACVPGRVDRYRFVYNAQWGRQVRTYDVLPSHTGEGAVLITRVFGEASLTQFDPQDPAAAWRGAYERGRLSSAEVEAIAAALGESGIDRPAPAGTWLRSDDFWWAVAACRDGRFAYNVWIRETADLMALPFIASLLRQDPTGIAVRRPPRELSLPPYDVAADVRKQTGDASLQTFRMEVGRNGLKLGPVRL